MLWKSLVLRGAGFPAEAVLRLASPSGAEAAGEASRLLEAERLAAAEALRAVHAALDDLRCRGAWDDKEKRRPLLKAMQALTGGKLPKDVDDPACAAAFGALRAGRTALDASRAELAEVYAAESFRISRELEQVAAGGRFREAVAWQNRHAVETALDSLARQSAEPVRRGSQRRQHEELVASYLQRYCVKNDSIGFFGPLGYGELTDGGPAVQVRPGPELLDRREVFFENWCIDALAQALSADPALRPWLAPRLKSSFHLEADGTLHQPFGRPVRPPAAEARLLAGCDGRRTARDLARDLMEDSTLGLTAEAEVYTLLEDLCRRRIVTWTLEVPLELHPDRTLEEQLVRIEAEDLRERALSALDDLRRGRDAVARAAGDARALDAALRGLEETFTRHTGLAPRHHQGQTYAARGLVYEDCRRAVEARFGPELLERLGPPLTLLLQGARWLAGELTQRIEERLCAIHADLRRRTGRDAVDCHLFYAQALTSLFLKKERDACFAAAEQAYQERWARVLRQDGEPAPERFLRFTAAELAGPCAREFGNPGPAWSLARYFSPDVLISAAGEDALRRGEYELVLGEVHASNTLLWSCFIAQHPDPAQVLEALRRDAAGRTYVFPQLLKHSVPQRMNIGVSMPELLWFHFADDPPARGASGVLPAGALVVEEKDGRLWARTRDGLLTVPAVDLFSTQLTQECNGAIGDLLPPAAHRPRISVDGVVISRERWRVAAAALEAAAVPDPAERFRRMLDWAREAGMPRFCFYRTTGERKPCYLDLQSPLYVDIFARLVRAAGEEGSVTLTEMLPRLDQIWLADAAGQRYTCELRMVALDAPQGADLRP